MIRDDKTKFLLYIEPTSEQKGQIMIDDEWTMLLRVAMSEGKLGTSNYSEPGEPEIIFDEDKRYKGVHFTEDGVSSANYDILLPNGMITNSLCVHYLLWYRLAIPSTDWEKLKDLQRYYGRSINVQQGRQM